MIFINSNNIDVKIENPKFGKKKKCLFKHLSRGTVQSLKNLRYESAEFYNFNAGDVQVDYFVQKTTEQHYCIVMAKKVVAESTLIAFTVCVGDDKSCIESGITLLKKVLSNNYESNIKNHLEWWKNYWNKSNVLLVIKNLSIIGI